MTTSNLIPKKDAPILPQLRLRIDVWIALSVAGLLISGMLVIYSSSFDLGFRADNFGNDPAYFLRREVYFFGAGLVAMLFFMAFDYHWLRKISVLMMGGTIVSLVLLLALGSLTSGDGELAEVTFGARRGFFGGSIQPSEIAKLTVIIYVSHWLSTKGDRVRSIQYGLFPFAIMVGIICGLIVVQPDLSTGALIALISFTLFFLAGADFKHFLLAIAVAVVAFILLTEASDYARARIEDWQIGFEEPLNAPYQLKLSMIALSGGELFGKGVGQGEVKYIIPVAHSDFVFAVWGEEFGFVGSLFVIGSFGLFAWRGILAARRARDMFGYLLALGVTCWISYQALMNIAVITSTMPATGIPLPFMSYGGSSMVMSMAAVGLLLNVSRDRAIGKTLKTAKPANTGKNSESNDMRRRNGRTRLSRTRRRPSA